MYTYFKKRRDEKIFKIRSKVTRIYFNMHKGYPNSFKNNTIMLIHVQEHACVFLHAKILQVSCYV